MDTHSHQHNHEQPIDTGLSSYQRQEMSRREMLAKTIGITGATLFMPHFIAGCGAKELVSDDGTVLPGVSEPLEQTDEINNRATAYEQAVRLDPPDPPPKDPVILIPPGSHVVDGDRRLKVVSYQSDDIPGPSVARGMMDVCISEGVGPILGQAVVGIYVNSHPDVMQEMVSLGFPIISHSRTHSYNINTNISELDYMQSLIKGYTGKDNRLFTNPGGYVNRTLLNALAARGMYYRWISVDLEDWKLPRPTPQTLINRHKNALLNGYRQFLIHGSDSNRPTLQALPQMFRDAKSLGFQIVTPEEHMAMGTPMVRASNLLDTQLQINDSYVTEGKFEGISQLEANWLLTLETSLNDSVNLTKENREIIENELKTRKKALGIL